MGEHGWTLGAVALGWLLAELGQHWRMRREDRRAFGRALSFVLEVQRQVYTLCELIRDATFAQLAEADRQAFNASLQRAATTIVSAGSKFEEAVDLVAGVDPLLGARVRNWGTYSVGEVLAAAATSNSPLELLRAAEPVLGMALTRISELVDQLSWRHGLWTWIHWRTRRSTNVSLATFMASASLGTLAGGRTKG